MIKIAKTSLGKEKISILLLENIHQTAEKKFLEAGYTNVVHLVKSPSKNELKERIKGVHFLGIRSRTKISNNILESADKLAAIGVSA